MLGENAVWLFPICKIKYNHHVTGPRVCGVYKKENPNSDYVYGVCDSIKPNYQSPFYPVDMECN